MGIEQTVQGVEEHNVARLQELSDAIATMIEERAQNIVIQREEKFEAERQSLREIIETLEVERNKLQEKVKDLQMQHDGLRDMYARLSHNAVQARELLDF